MTNTNRIRKRIKILIIIFITMLLITLLYLHEYPESELLKGENLGENTIVDDNNIPKNIPSQYNNEELEEIDLISPKDVPFTIVTGASANHFCPLKSFLYSVHEVVKEYKNARIVVYDLGLTDKQRKEANRIQNKGYITNLKLFDWSKYPSFWDINNARGEYAWKPGMVHESSKEYPGIIIWLDSGTKVQEILFRNLNEFLDEFDGFISPESPGLMVNWTHPGVYDYFNDDHTKFDNLPNCNGASIIFDTKRTQSLIDDWYKCALDKDCIAPPGSSRQNHRQDQSLLTYLAAKEGRLCDQGRDYFGFLTHDDKNCKDDIDKYEHEHNI